MMRGRSILLAAVMGMSLSLTAFAEPNGGASASAGSSASGNQNQTGGSAPAVGGTGLTTPSDADRGTGASGSMDNDQSRDLNRGAMGGDVDAMLGRQFDKLASQPDKAADGLFVLDNAAGNLFEIKFAQLAQQKSQDQQIKDLARMIERDHTQANEQLKTIAQKFDLELPMQLPTAKQKMLQVLSNLPEKDFNTCYLLDNKMVHAKDVTSFADHQKSVKDEDLRRYITTVLPKLEQHGQHVQQIAAAQGFSTPMAVGGSSNGASGTGGMGNIDNDTTRTRVGNDAGSSSGSSTGGTGASGGTGSSSTGGTGTSGSSSSGSSSGTGTDTTNR